MAIYASSADSYEQIKEDLYRSDLELLKVAFQNEKAIQELSSSRTSVKVLGGLIVVLALLAVLSVFIKMVN